MCLGYPPTDCSATGTVGFRRRWRIKILRRTAAIMQERREELAVEAAREGGKPLMDSAGRGWTRAIDRWACRADHLRTQAGAEIPMNRNAASAGRVAFTQYEPLGVVLALARSTSAEHDRASSGAGRGGPGVR